MHIMLGDMSHGQAPSWMCSPAETPSTKILLIEAAPICKKKKATCHDKLYWYKQVFPNRPNEV